MNRNNDSAMTLRDEKASKMEDAKALLQHIAHEYEPVVMACGFGPESMVLLDIIACNKFSIEPFCLDTLRLPDETYQLARVVKDRYGIAVRMLQPDPVELNPWLQENGQNAFYRSVKLRKQCCELRKVLPLRHHLRGRKAWITGLRRAQSAARSDLRCHEWDTEYGLHKFNPLASWSDEEIWSYIREHDVPYNSLHDRGYASIGCEPCTRAIRPGEDRRAGRWWWESEAQKECGIHAAREGGMLRLRGKRAVPETNRLVIGEAA